MGRSRRRRRCPYRRGKKLLAQNVAADVDAGVSADATDERPHSREEVIDSAGAGAAERGKPRREQGPDATSAGAGAAEAGPPKRENVAENAGTGAAERRTLPREKVADAITAGGVAYSAEGRIPARDEVTDAAGVGAGFIRCNAKNLRYSWVYPTYISATRDNFFNNMRYTSKVMAVVLEGEPQRLARFVQQRGESEKNRRNLDLPRTAH